MKAISLKMILIVAVALAAIAGIVVINQAEANSAQVAAEPGTGWYTA
jgi:Flp pilus assembly protein CpaB